MAITRGTGEKFFKGTKTKLIAYNGKVYEAVAINSCKIANCTKLN